jgi:hypothetical protein
MEEKVSLNSHLGENDAEAAPATSERYVPSRLSVVAGEISLESLGL